MRILLVDDDRALSEALTIALQKLHYTVDSVQDGEEAWHYGSIFEYDLMIIDWMIPTLDGVQLCQRFRDNGCHVPILLITARNSCTDKVLGLDSGADDYVNKPFDFDELLARVRALLRRSSDRSTPTLAWGDLELDPKSCEVTFQNRLLILTATEYALLELFLRRENHVFSIESIADNVWSSGKYPANATVRSHIRGLRSKLKKAGMTSDIIETVSGIGYRLISVSNSVAELSTRSTEADERQRCTYVDRNDELNKIWDKHKSTHINNLAIVEHCFRSPIEINPEKLTICKDIIHKLSGTLGTFGFAYASKLSGDLEQLLSSQPKALNIPSKQVLAMLSAIKTEICFHTTEQQSDSGDRFPSYSKKQDCQQDLQEACIPRQLGDRQLTGVIQDLNVVEGNCTLIAIDDDPLFLSMLESIVRPVGFNVVTFSGQIDILSILDGINPSLLMLDIEMPHINGFDICRTIRQHSQWLQLPIMFVSAHTDSDSQHTAFSVGADDYISKPVEGEQILTRIFNRLARINGYRSITAA